MKLYFSVTLPIFDFECLKTAEITHVDAVWPGWGHAFEIPELPDALEAKCIIFIGPPTTSMVALRDKIGSSLIAQAADEMNYVMLGDEYGEARSIALNGGRVWRWFGLQRGDKEAFGASSLQRGDGGACKVLGVVVDDLRVLLCYESNEISLITPH
ncbi:acetyl-CoA carboxylase 1-like protein isoform X1 [Tanacetum coccineum]|uniref:Acetyl-CoA carboxylase 1-like protein isoform X1 n=1 Tax=Tanacetum coccineum TaxID=301880 RepID=A0ABQ5FYL2_9ASTR